MFPAAAEPKGEPGQGGSTSSGRCESLTVVSWNVHGRSGLAVNQVAHELEQVAADLVCLQEIQRHQARALARRLGWRWVWAFKHWPVAARAEGAAVLSAHPLGPSSVVVLQPALPLRWQRRIALLVEADLGGMTLQVASVHLSPQGPAQRQRQELDRLGHRLGHQLTSRPRPGDRGTGPAATLVLGDLNQDSFDELRPVIDRHGLADCWTAAGPDRQTGDGLTHWTTGQRLDYALVSPGLEVARAQVPSDRVDELGPLSDHLPLIVELRARRAVR
jgi:endonuclease/exonuclease/phosphatase family metal-dependent hydrolase